MKTKKSRRKDLLGMVFGRLTVIADAGINASGCGQWLCVCSCGTEKTVCISNLGRSTLSCGCKNAENLRNYNATKVVSDETKKKLSLFFKGRKSTRKNFTHSPETIEKLRELTTGKTLSLEARKKLSESIRGENSCHWKGGLTDEHSRIRKSLEYKLWRQAVYERDEWTCQVCFQKGRKLNAHHVKSFSLFPDLRFEVDNGVTMCKDCHQERHRGIPRVK